MKFKAPATGARVAFTTGAIFNLGPHEEAEFNLEVAPLVIAAGCIQVPENDDLIVMRERAIRAAVAGVLAERKPESFDEAGVVKTTVITAIVGMPVQKAEIVAAMAELNGLSA
jgi:hypothetical protein